MYSLTWKHQERNLKGHYTGIQVKNFSKLIHNSFRNYNQNQNDVKKGNFDCNQKKFRILQPDPDRDPRTGCKIWIATRIPIVIHFFYGSRSEFGSRSKFFFGSRSRSDRNQQHYNLLYTIPHLKYIIFL